MAETTRAFRANAGLYPCSARFEQLHASEDSVSPFRNGLPFPQAGTARAPQPRRVCTPALGGAFIVDRGESIEAIARKLGRATYMDLSTGIPGVKGIPHVAPVAEVTCYRGEQMTTSFTIREFGCIETTDGQWFDLKDTGLNFSEFTPGVQPFISHLRCASNIREVAGVWAPYIPLSPVAYPAADGWCDITLNQRLRRYGASPEFTRHAEGLFQCPGAGEGKCHYAMNPNCQRDSQPDTVLLFETKAGWNQHGGPELFTFDNHEPRGGCVLLNDGTVKFIRSEEELRQLRWK
jgi:hypothetical protein